MTQLGTVVAFDRHAGWGTVRAEGDEGDEGGEMFFHCTAIADGTRMIDPGTPVSYDIRPGHNGQWEATGLRS